MRRTSGWGTHEGKGRERIGWAKRWGMKAQRQEEGREPGLGVEGWEKTERKSEARKDRRNLGVGKEGGKGIGEQGCRQQEWAGRPGRGGAGRGVCSVRWGPVPAPALLAASPPPAAGPVCPPDVVAAPSPAASAVPAPAVVAVGERRVVLRTAHSDSPGGGNLAHFGHLLERRPFQDNAPHLRRWWERMASTYFHRPTYSYTGAQAGLSLGKITCPMWL